MAKLVRSFRAKILMLFGLSIFLSSTLTYIIYKVLQFYYHTTVEFEDSLARFRRIINNIGDINFFLLIFIPLSILFFFLFTKRYANYFNEISNGIHHLARGDFSHRVKITSNDEFGSIAQDINLANEKLEQAIKRGDFSESSKDQLVVNLAHDLRTPLTSVIGYIDLLLNDKDLTEEQIKHFLNIAYTKSQRLEKLIDELFEITRMNYGMLLVEKQEIDISELLFQLKEELFPAFKRNDLTARINIPYYLPVLGDGEMLARVFENLLTNAIRYGDEGHFVDINGFVNSNEVVVQIVNYGAVIPENELPYLFDVFYRGNKARTYQENSTGLGLFIAKNIIEQHNGLISAESSLLKTIFEVRLPKRDDEA